MHFVVSQHCYARSFKIESGRDAISIIPIGENLLFVYTPCVLSVKRMREFDDFSIFISDGPESAIIQKNVFYNIPQPD